MRRKKKEKKEEEEVIGLYESNDSLIVITHLFKL